jgi:hypothetical protein
MAHIGIDFEPTLTRLITALIDGMTHPEHLSAQDPTQTAGPKLRNAL